MFVVFFKQKTAYGMRISDWSSDVCSSDLKQGFRITRADDADAARTRLAAYSIDLVILDIMMPGEDGLSLTRHIRETTDIPVILLTARTEEKIGRASCRERVCQYV